MELYASAVCTNAQHDFPVSHAANKQPSAPCIHAWRIWTVVQHKRGWVFAAFITLSVHSDDSSGCSSSEQVERASCT